MKPGSFYGTILLFVCFVVSACAPSHGLTLSQAPTNTASASTSLVATLPPSLPNATQTALPVASPTSILTEISTEVPTELPTALPTEVSTALPTDVPALGSTRVSASDGMLMVYVPAGDFSMGSQAGPVDEQPVHTVSLDAFWIDRTEVTNAMYSQCVAAGACLRPYVLGSNTHYSYYFDPLYADYPVIALKWSSADAYCTWAGRHLPTEAQWEKAAIGTDGRIYPWGNELPKNTLLNFNRAVNDTARVGSYPLGASPYGAWDMAGNVNEWTADWYDDTYYASSPSSNPTGPATGQYKVLRGGSWISDVYVIRSADRHWLAPDTRDITVGFRCAATSP
jgi:formylglycine-generating enzyme required for sulfatase activity